MKFLIILVILIAFPYASLQATDLNTYEPPPLFAPQMDPPPRRKVEDVPTIPAISKPVFYEDEPTEEKEVLIKSRIFKAPVDDDSASEPKKALQEPPKIEVEKKTEEKIELPSLPPIPADIKNIVKPEVKPVVPSKKTGVKQLEPIDLLKKKDVPKPPQIIKEAPKAQPKAKTPTPKKSSEGIVKGPKTMPSVKKQSVEAEVIYEGKAQEPVTILERMKSTDVAEEQAVEPASQPKRAINTSFLPKFSDEGVLVLLFNQGQGDLQSLQKDTLDGVILPQLQDNPSKRIMLTAFAALQDGALNSDRKMALSRALAIRKHLIAAQIAPDRIDIRSLGAQSDVQPIDRVEIGLGG